MRWQFFLLFFKNFLGADVDIVFYRPKNSLFLVVITLFHINHVPIVSIMVLGFIVNFTSSCDCCCWCTHTILRRLSLEMTRYICLAFHKMCIAAMMNHNASSWVGPNEAEDSCRASGNSPRKGPEKILRVRSRSRLLEIYI